MIRKKYCGTAAKAGGNGENKPHPKIMGGPYLLENSRSVSVFIVSLLAAVVASAAVEPSTVMLTCTNTQSVATYTVPAGRVLIIRQVLRDYEVELYVKKGAQEFVIKDFPGGWLDGKLVCIDPPLVFGEGWTLSCKWTSGTVLRTCYVLGLLATPDDLFAAISSEIESLAIADGDAILGIHTPTARPAKVRVLTVASLLDSWAPVETSSVARADTPGDYAVTTPAHGKKRFFRAQVRSAR